MDKILVLQNIPEWIYFTKMSNIFFFEYSYVDSNSNTKTQLFTLG
jgi:hypothetical protein